MPNPRGPISSGERIPALDIVRGVALLGIFIMNMPTFSHSLFASAGEPEFFGAGLNAHAAVFRELVFAGKFNSMFSLLFGIGFTLQLGRLQATQPERATWIYVRRLLVLLALGLVHAGLIWSGDVLVVYAVLGFVLLLLRRAPDALLLGLLGACLLYPAASEMLRPHLLTPEVEAIAAFVYGDFEASNNHALGQGSFVDAAIETSRMLAWGYGTTMGRWSYAAFYVQMGTALFLGYFVGRRGWVRRLPELMPRIRRIQWAALAVGGVCTAVFTAARAWAEAVDPSALTLLVNSCQTFGRFGLMIFYVLTLVRLAHLPAWQRRLAPFATAGRMPLSNYLLQTAMATFIFYGWGLGLWGRAGPVAELVLAVLLFTLVQLPLSIWWFRHWKTGPLEYAWRVLTYGARSRLS